MNVEAKREKDFFEINFNEIARDLLLRTAPDVKYAEFRMNHTNRVYEIAKELMSFYTPQTSVDFGYSNEWTMNESIVKIMIDIHDAFKYVAENDHGKAARNFFTIFIESYYANGSGDDDIKSHLIHAVNAIEMHSEKYVNTPNIYARLLMDADMIDKVHPEFIKASHETFNKNEDINMLMHYYINEVLQYKPYGGPGFNQVCKKYILESIGMIENPAINDFFTAWVNGIL